jgi:rSAM/selenodomain-associated transferase 1
MNAIVIIAKEPKPGSVKTRLTPPLDPQTASKIYHNLLLDRIEQVESLKGADHFVAYYPKSSLQFFQNIISSSFSLLPQKGKDLGERLSNIFSDLFKEGYERIVIMDSDSPNLPSRHISEGLRRLNEADLILGPCEDGGYYLVGLSSNMPQIFQGIPWSTSEVTKLTIEKARAMDKNISLLEKWYDVDTIEDLRRLRTELDSYLKAPNDTNFCRNTYEIISEYHE